MDSLKLYYKKAWEYEFYKLPKFLFEREEFEEMSFRAKLLYAALLDRSSVSEKNGWIDRRDNVFIKYTLNEACEFLSCSLPTAVKVFRELEEAGLIEKKKGRKGGADKIYVLVFIN